MVPDLLIAGPGSALIAVRLGAAGEIAANAAAMLREELSARFPAAEVRILPPDGRFPGTAASTISLEVAAPGAGGLAPEGFRIVARASGAATEVSLTGADPAGLLYAACELLDRLVIRAQALWCPPLDLTDAPDCSVRGLSSASQAGALLVSGPEGLAKACAALRGFARARCNLITVTAAPTGWPGDLTPLLTFDEFPALADPAREAAAVALRGGMREFLRCAHSWGIRVVLYSTEFNYQPELLSRCPEMVGVLPETWAEGHSNYVRAALCVSRDRTWEYFRAKLRETLRVLPELDGIELWMAEAPSELQSCACPSCRAQSWTDKVSRFAREARAAVDAVRPQAALYLRTFLSAHGAREPEVFLPLAGKLPEGVQVVLKGQFGDMAYLNDPHPLAGAMTQGAETVEFDLGGEYRGGGMGTMISCVPGYLAERMRHYGGKGIRRFLGRHAYHSWPNKDLISINDVAFARLCWNLRTDVESLWLPWAEGLFGAAAAPGAVRILKQTDELVRKSLYARGVCINRHYYLFPDSVSSFVYMMTDLSAKMIQGGMERITPTPQTIAAVVAEKDEAVSLSETILRELEAVRPALSPDLARRLDVLLRRGHYVVRIMRPLAEATFRYLLWVRTLSELERDAMRPGIRRVLDACELEIDEAEERCPRDGPPDRQVWSFRKVIDLDRPRRLCQEIRGELDFRVSLGSDFQVVVQPTTVGHPNTYREHQEALRSMFSFRRKP